MWTRCKSSSTETPLRRTHSRRAYDLWARIAVAARAFGADTRGVILPYVTVMLSVIVGVSVLALDGARYTSLQTQLQKGADALALAGAAELNGYPDAITRATAAITNTNASWVSNSSVFGTGANANVSVNVSNIVFYSGLPAGSVNPIPSSYVTTDPSQAKYVQVTATPTTITTVLPASFFGGSNSVTTGAVAVAGSNQTICGAQPLFVCNPFETAAMNSYSLATQALLNADSSLVTHQVRITSPPGGSYGPGDYGWIQPSTQSTSNQTCGSGGQTTGEVLAVTTPNSCNSVGTVNLNPGYKTPTMEALNIRFDIYLGPWKNCNSDSNYAPDQNVRKGYIGGGCSAKLTGPQPPSLGYTGKSPLSDQAAAAMPDDNCIIAGTCGTGTSGPPYGDGNWVCGDITNIQTTATVINVSIGGPTQITLPVSSTTGIYPGMAVTFPLLTAPDATVQQVSANSVTITNPSGINVSLILAGTNLTFTGYWNTAHPNTTMPTGCQGSPYASISRHELYMKYENSSRISDVSSGGESGAPSCSSSTPDSSGQRRILTVPIINCLNSPVTINGAATGVPVVGYGQIFMTKPYDDQHDITYGEYLGLVQPGSAGPVSLVESVQLYR